jgi:hypothetical protein
MKSAIRKNNMKSVIHRIVSTISYFKKINENIKKKKILGPV